VILLDTNILLYAYNASFPQHERARAWLERTLSSATPVAFSWQTILAFLRIGTHPRAFREPWTAAEARGIVATWLESPLVVVLQPAERHWGIFSGLVTVTHVRGPQVMDAHLAALAVEHGATLCTTDAGFRVFPGVRFMNPLEETA
jgi:hypothetical protein